MKTEFNLKFIDNKKKLLKQMQVVSRMNMDRDHLSQVVMYRIRHDLAIACRDLDPVGSRFDKKIRIWFRPDLE